MVKIKAIYVYKIIEKLLSEVNGYTIKSVTDLRNENGEIICGRVDMTTHIIELSTNLSMIEKLMTLCHEIGHIYQIDFYYESSKQNDYQFNLLEIAAERFALRVLKNFGHIPESNNLNSVYHEDTLPKEHVQQAIRLCDIMYGQFRREINYAYDMRLLK